MILGPVVVDASAVVEYLVRLRWPEGARRVFRSMVAGTVELLAPDLVFLESTSALRRLVQTKAIDARAGNRATAVLAQLPIRSMGTQQLLDDVWGWRESLTPYDAAYAALTKRMDATLVTDDQGLVTACRRRGIRVVTLEQLSS